MQIAIPADSEETTRIIALNAAQWFYDATQTEPDTAGDVVDMAALFEAYLTNGHSVEYHCNPDLRHCVSGKKP